MEHIVLEVLHASEEQERGKHTETSHVKKNKKKMSHLLNTMEK